MTHGRLLLVQVGNERLALGIETVREVQDAPNIEPVPLAPQAVVGQLAVRGEFLPVLELGTLLGIHALATRSGVALVMAEGRYALRADDVVDFWEADTVQIRPLPAGGDPRGLLRGVAQCAQEVAGLVDSAALHGVAVATLRASTAS